MNTVNIVQQRITQAEETLKFDFGYSSKDLENVGAKSTSAKEYMVMLEDEINVQLEKQSLVSVRDDA